MISARKTGLYDDTCELSKMPRHSKIQMQVLNLYKQFLRAANGRPGMVQHVRNEFRKQAVIPRTDSMRIEFHIRRGQRQLELIKKPTVQSIGSFEKKIGS